MKSKDSIRILADDNEYDKVRTERNTARDEYERTGSTQELKKVKELDIVLERYEKFNNDKEYLKAEKSEPDVLKPKVIERIDYFFKLWLNPKGLKGDSFPLEEIHIATLMQDFVFKWYVTEEQLKEAAAYIKTDIINGTLNLSVNEWEVELSVREGGEVRGMQDLLDGIEN